MLKLVKMDGSNPPAWVQKVIKQEDGSWAAMVQVEEPDGEIAGFTFVRIGQKEAEVLQRELEEWGLLQDN
jgi:hypothetical protein